MPGHVRQTIAATQQNTTMLDENETGSGNALLGHARGDDRIDECCELGRVDGSMGVRVVATGAPQETDRKRCCRRDSPKDGSHLKPTASWRLGFDVSRPLG